MIGDQHGPATRQLQHHAAEQPDAEHQLRGDQQATLKGFAIGDRGQYLAQAGRAFALQGAFLNRGAKTGHRRQRRQPVGENRQRDMDNQPAFRKAGVNGAVRRLLPEDGEATGKDEIGIEKRTKPPAMAADSGQSREQEQTDANGDPDRARKASIPYPRPCRAQPRGDAGKSDAKQKPEQNIAPTDSAPR